MITEPIQAAITHVVGEKTKDAHLQINNNRQQKCVLLIGHNSHRQTKNYTGTLLTY